jgi:hypothetical protein
MVNHGHSAGAIDEGDFHVKFILRDESDEFKFVLYGSRASATS